MTKMEKWNEAVNKKCKENGYVTFAFNNLNPKGKRTCDCTTRAMALATDKTYEEILKMQFDIAMETGHFIDSKENEEELLKRCGYVKMKQPRKADGTKYLVGEINKLTTNDQRWLEGVVVSMAGHLTCIKGDVIQDTWNCALKTIGNYYVRG